MFKRGEVYENPATGERAVIRVGTDENAGARLVVDLYIRPGGAVAGEHVHPAIRERFTVLQGRVGFSIGGKKSVAKLSRVLEPATLIRNPNRLSNQSSASPDARVELDEHRFRRRLNR